MQRHESQSAESKMEHLVHDYKKCQQENAVLEQEIETYKRELAASRLEQQQLAQTLESAGALGSDADRIRMELSACQHENATLRRRLDDKEGLLGVNERDLERFSPCCSWRGQGRGREGEVVEEVVGGAG